jgi:hypothetical protein
VHDTVGLRYVILPPKAIAAFCVPAPPKLFLPVIKAPGLMDQARGTGAAVVVVVLVVVVVVVVGAAVVVVVVVVGAAVVVVLVVVVVGAAVVVVVVDTQGIVCVIELAQGPVEVTVTWVAISSTLTFLPANSSLLVAVEGVTEPTLAVRLKLGPRLLPNPLPNINNIFLAIFV